jgi:hypothetical protein
MEKGSKGEGEDRLPEEGPTTWRKLGLDLGTKFLGTLSVRRVGNLSCVRVVLLPDLGPCVSKDGNQWRTQPATPPNPNLRISWIGSEVSVIFPTLPPPR